MSPQNLTKEIVREKLWQNLNQEVPYSMEIVLTKWDLCDYEGEQFAQQIFLHFEKGPVREQTYRERLRRIFIVVVFSDIFTGLLRRKDVSFVESRKCQASKVHVRLVRRLVEHGRVNSTLDLTVSPRLADSGAMFVITTATAPGQQAHALRQRYSTEPIERPFQ